MPIGEGDDAIFYNANDFAEDFQIEESGGVVTAIFNDPSGNEPVAGFDIDFSKPYLEASVTVSILLTEGTVIFSPSRGNRRFQVSSRPVSQGDGDYLIPLVELPAL